MEGFLICTASLSGLLGISALLGSIFYKDAASQVSALPN